jgi:Fur family zinc uptake transcriptional regulator
MPHDGHDHSPCAKSALALAEATCAENGSRLTPQRRRVLEAIATARTPVGAYDLIDRLADADGSRPAPITVYRALDFLMAEGLVHRIASKNAYLACNHSHDADAAVVFLLCDACGNVREVSDPAVAKSLSAAAKSVGFAASRSVLEMTGTCAACATSRAEGIAVPTHA